MGRERIENMQDLKEWRMTKINELVEQYEDTYIKHTKTRQGILSNIKLLEEEVNKID